MSELHKTEAMNDTTPVRDVNARISESTEINTEDKNSTTPEIDRGAFNPRGRLKDTGKAGKAGLLVGAMFIGFLVYNLASGSEKPMGRDDTTYVEDDNAAETSAKQAAASVTASNGSTDITTDPLGNQVLDAQGQDLSQDPTTANAGQLTPEQQAALQAQQAREAERQRKLAQLEAMRRAPILALSQSSSGPASDRGGNSGLAQAGVQTERPRNALSERMNGMDIERVNARKVSNRNFLIPAGNQISCVLQTAMDSTQPGLTSCIIPNDVWSANGRVILMEKGTRVLGEYQGGFSTGEHRIFVLWNRAVTPRGVSVTLASPAADSLGRSGMGGKVDTFFWQRFGAALLLSVVGDASSAVANNLSGVDQTLQAPNSAAAVAAQDSQRIKPRLRAPQGQEMTIMVSRDLDFSNVYSVGLKR